jgi:deazaflavin-dependent oxidoreductase (nitroreductase family)
LTTYQESPPTPLTELVRDQSRRRALGVAVGRLVDLPIVGLWIARLGRLPNQIPGLTTRVTRFHAWLVRRSGGRLRRSWLFAAGQPVVSLTTTGRKSGKPRSTAVACFVDGDDLVMAGMNLGRVDHPAWALNLTANPAAEITIEGQTVPVNARRAYGAERARLWERWLELQPSADAFRELAGREIPLFVVSRRSPAA